MRQEIFHKLMSLLEFKEDYQVKSSGLNYLEIHVLEYIFGKKEIKTLEISKSLNIPPSTLIAVLDKLERMNLIVRSRQKDDKRIVLVSLTLEGSFKVESHLKEDELFLKNLIRKLSEEEGQSFIYLLDKMTSIEDPAELFKE